MCEQKTIWMRSKGRGTPGKDIPVDPKIMDSERENDYDWYNVIPPTPSLRWTQSLDSFYAGLSSEFF